MSSIFARFFIIFSGGFYFFSNYLEKMFYECEGGQVIWGIGEIFYPRASSRFGRKGEAPERSLELSRASPYYIDVLKSEAGNSSGCEPFMGRTLGPLDGPRLILGGQLK